MNRKIAKPSEEFFQFNPELVDLHVHIGSISHPALLWDIGHELGLKLPVKNYWSFKKLISCDDPLNGETQEVRLNQYLKFFDLTEKIQSSPYAMDRVVYDAVSGAYRTNNITKLELRFCPMLRNNNGAHDLDQIIIAAIHALDRGMIAFPEVKAGLIFSFDRRLSKRANSVILEKAIKYRDRGVIGIDTAGPRRSAFDYLDYKDLYQEATNNGLNTTVHTGEEGDAQEMEMIVDNLPLNRIGHGIKAAESSKLMRKLADKNITLELCPTSNLRIGIVKDMEHFKRIVRSFVDAGVKFTVNTDGPELLHTNIKKEISLLLDNHVLSVDEMHKVIETSNEVSFLTGR
jgi:adenosine deaminase